jgi:hypothetical protein
MVVSFGAATAAPARDWPAAGRCLPATASRGTCIQVSRADAIAIRTAVIEFVDGAGKARLERATRGHPRVATRFRALAKRPNTDSSIGGLLINGFRIDRESVEVGMTGEDGNWTISLIVFVERDGASWRAVDVVGSLSRHPRDEPLAAD